MPFSCVSKRPLESWGTVCQERRFVLHNDFSFSVFQSCYLGIFRPGWPRSPRKSSLLLFCLLVWELIKNRGLRLTFLYLLALQQWGQSMVKVQGLISTPLTGLPCIPSLFVLTVQQAILENSLQAWAQYLCDGEPASKVWLHLLSPGHWDLNPTRPNRPGKQLPYGPWQLRDCPVVQSWPHQKRNCHSISSSYLILGKSRL